MHSGMSTVWRFERGLWKFVCLTEEGAKPCGAKPCDALREGALLVALLSSQLIE